MPSNEEERPNLDILRSVAVTAVLVDHLVPTLKHQIGYSNNFLSALTVHIGAAGVLAFFVHTSLVLMHSLDRLHRSGRGQVALRFYVRRFFRIYPLSICCVGTVLFLGIPAMTWRTTPPITPSVVISNLLLVQNLWTKQSVLGPLWSLPYEIQMYLVLPILHRLARGSRPVVGLLTLITIFCMFGTMLNTVFNHLNMAAYIPCFLAGVLCYALERRQRAVIPGIFWLFSVLGLVTAYCISNLCSREPIFWVGWIYCLVLGVTINRFHESVDQRKNKIFKRIATYSYGLYLWHVPALYAVFSCLRVPDPLLGTALFLVLTVALSVASYHFLEAPMIELGRHLSTSTLSGARLRSSPSKRRNFETEFD